jgi:hypothetical protein
VQRERERERERVRGRECATARKRETRIVVCLCVCVGGERKRLRVEVWGYFAIVHSLKEQVVANRRTTDVRWAVVLDGAGGPHGAAPLVFCQR